MEVLGVSALYHDAAAALVSSGQIVAAGEEERFTRRKHDSDFPREAIAYCLESGGVEKDGLDAVVFYEKPLLTFLRLIRTRFAVAPRGFAIHARAMRQWTRKKLWVGYELEKILADLGYDKPRHMWFSEHHLSHAAAAFFPSPFDRAAICTFDGVGEFATTSIGQGVRNTVELRREIDFPNSIGLLYSTFTAYCGFRVNDGEYKLMGLAPYGRPRYLDRILGRVVRIHPDGSFSLDMAYFDFLKANRMYSKRFCSLFDGPARAEDEPITARHCDLARSVQEAIELLVLAIANEAYELTGQPNLCLAGGVALNCVSNARLLREGPFENIWVQPASGDSGSALGAALYGAFQLGHQARTSDGVHDRMRGTFLGPAFDDAEIEVWLKAEGRDYSRLAPEERARRIAELIARGAVVALVQGRMEFGPRALGNRSILADARDPDMQRVLNQRIKKRESFRPFAPAVKAEAAAAWFELDRPSPYMLFTAPVHPDHRHPAGEPTDDIIELAGQVRSDIPAVTHVDQSARVQTVERDSNPEFWAILDAFEQLTGCPVLVNTSFNVRDEPIVCTPQDAYRSFLSTDVDHLVLGSFLLDR